MLATDPITTFDDATLLRMERRAWYEAAHCWTEYRAAVHAEGFVTTEHGAELAREGSRILHDAAWSAENHWRHLHDERTRRGLAIAAA